MKQPNKNSNFEAKSTPVRIDARLLSQAISGIVYDYDAVRGSTVRSEGLFEVLGFYPEEAEADVLWWNSRIHPLDRERVLSAFQSAQTHCQIEYRIKHKLGHYVHIWDRAIILRDSKGAIQRVVGNNLDISRFKEIEQMLESAYRAERDAREAAERTAYHLSRLHRIATGCSLVLGINEIAATIAEELKTTFSADSVLLCASHDDNADVEFLTLQGESELFSDNLSSKDFLGSVAFKGVSEAIPSSMFSPRIFQALDLPESDFCRRNGWIGTLVVAPICIAGRQLGIVALEFREQRLLSVEERQFLPIMLLECAQALERARLYESERTSRERAEAANRAKDEFFAIVSHELRSPLQSILGWIRLARTSKLDATTSERALEVMERNTRAQVQLVSDMLEASRIVTGKVSMTPENVSINSVIESSLEAVKAAAANKDIEIVFHSNVSIPSIWGDPNRLQQVFWNLLSNAVKFTPKGGKVLIAPTKYGGGVKIDITDTGEGIADEFLPYIFDRFAQADESKARVHGGLGLGLAIARHIVQLHGGDISVFSLGRGKGSTFSVFLPEGAVSTVEKPEVPKRIIKDIQSLQGVRVLVVEDTQDTRELLSEILKAEGAEVLCAESAPLALSVLNKFKPDLLLSDIGLADADGCALISEIRLTKSSKELPAAALTARVTKEEKERCLNAGFQTYLAKPVDPDILIEQLKSLANR